MSRAKLSIVGVVVLIGAAWFFGSPRTDGTEREPPVEVSADDLESGNVIVIGRLGIPLMTMATVRGTWEHPHGEHPAKDGSPTLHVTHVDGRPVEKPVEFHWGLIEMTGRTVDRSTVETGDVWEFRAFETGRFRQSPAEYAKAMHLGARQAAVWNRGTFLTELKGLLPRRAAPAKKGT
jgi:hypothetical protein